MMAKQCPTCKRTYSDESMSFCLEDGSILLAVSEEEAARRFSGPNALPDWDSSEHTQATLLRQEKRSPADRHFSQFDERGISHRRIRHKSNWLIVCISLAAGFSLAIILALALLNRPKEQRTITVLSSPSATARAYHAAFKNKDLEAWKRTLNAEYLKKSAETAAQKNLSLDAYLKQVLEKGSPYAAGEIEEIKNEKISGDRATLDVKIGGRWLKWDFVKENGEWKSL